MPEIELRYSNRLDVGFNAFEFVLAFGQQVEEADSAIIHTKIVTSPFYLKQFSELLGESIRDYEQSMGRIPDREG